MGDKLGSWISVSLCKGFSKNIKSNIHQKSIVFLKSLVKCFLLFYKLLIIWVLKYVNVFIVNYSLFPTSISKKNKNPPDTPPHTLNSQHSLGRFFSASLLLVSYCSTSWDHRGLDGIRRTHHSTVNQMTISGLDCFHRARCLLSGEYKGTQSIAQPSASLVVKFIWPATIHRLSKTPKRMFVLPSHLCPSFSQKLTPLSPLRKEDSSELTQRQPILGSVAWTLIRQHKCWRSWDWPASQEVSCRWVSCVTTLPVQLRKVPVSGPCRVMSHQFLSLTQRSLALVVMHHCLLSPLRIKTKSQSTPSILSRWLLIQGFLWILSLTSELTAGLH